MFEPFELVKLERSSRIAAKGRGSDVEVRSVAKRIARSALAQLAGQPIVTSAQIASAVLKLLGI